MLELKCPRCDEQFQAEPDETSHIQCPGCHARLRVKMVAAVGARPGPGAGEDESPNSVQAINMPDEEPDPNQDMLAPSTRLGGFEITRMLGRGGMSIVYKGVQLSLNRPVAVKVLAPRFSTNMSFIQRFDREAGALASLNHPNIVNIIDRGVAADRYFFVMELVQGINLDQLIQSVELTEKHYIHIITEISKALTYVHSKGIVHRDIKPSNVLVNKHGLVKVSDFGIAHITQGDFPPEKLGRNATVGTANYMSPEQAENPGAVDKRADIYALGVTFYKMFTRQLPVGAYRGASLLNPRLPRAIDPVLSKAMQANPQDRYQQVDEFCRALVECFAPAKKATGEASGPFIFNPELFDRRKATESDAPSDESSGSSPFGLLYVPGGASDSGLSTPSPFPAVKSPVPAQPRVPASDDDEASLGDSLMAKRRTIYILVAILVFIALALAAGFAAWDYYARSLG